MAAARTGASLVGGVLLLLGLAGVASPVLATDDQLAAGRRLDASDIRGAVKLSIAPPGQGT